MHLKIYKEIYNTTMIGWHS